MKLTSTPLFAACFLLMLLPVHYGCAARAIPVASTSEAQAVKTVNIMDYGADNTGQTDIAKLVRKAQQDGNVYFPKGTYLMGPVDVLPNRKYFGDGMGKTIIKAKQTKIKMLWGICTYDFDKSGHPERDIENVELCDMTLDYNFTEKWVDYYSMILFKGRPNNDIRNIKIQRIEFINSSKRVHPDIAGGGGKDAWSVNLSSFARVTENILVNKCISNAESHQFVAGGGSSLKHIVVTDNYMLRPHANGIAFTTVYEKDVNFEDFTVTGNTIIDPFGSAILFGHDPGASKFNGGRQTFTGLLVANNKIEFSDHKVYGKSYRTKKSFPFVFNISGGEPYMKNVIIRDNEINVTNEYSGNTICFGKIKSYTFKRDAATITAPFVQPAANKTVQVNVSPNLLPKKPFFPEGTFVRINGGGLYQIIKTSGQLVTLKLTDWESEARPGTTISTGSEITFRGGVTENIQFVNNRVTGSKTLRMVPGGIISGLVFKGNNKVDFTMPYAKCIIADADISNNTGFSFDQADGIITGTMYGNKLSKPLTAGKKLKAAATAVNQLKVKDNQ